MANQRICSVDGCGKEYRSKGLCNKHYQRLLNHGDPLFGEFKETICSVDGCGGPILSRGMCRAHYWRVHRHGDPHVLMKARSKDLIHFYEEVALKYEGTECLIWLYGGRDGYGQMTKNGRRGLVTRFLCEDVYGPPPSPEYHAAHSCGKGHIGCVAKSHLRWATPAENQADRILHDTHMRGERSHFAKLTEDQVKEIRSLRGKETQEAIAKRFGIAFQHVSKIHRGETWSWLED